MCLIKVMKYFLCHITCRLGADLCLRSIQTDICLCYHSTGKKRSVQAIYGNPSHSYGVSLAVWDHTVTFHPTQANTPHLYPSQTGWYSIYRPFKDGGLSKPRPRVQRATGPRLLLGSGTAGSRTREPVERKSDAVTITPPRYRATMSIAHLPSSFH